MEYYYQHNINMLSNIPSSSITVTENPDPLDPDRWRRLPNFLIARIFTFLPVPSLLRFRSLSRRWYNHLFSNSFLQAYLNTCRNHHWFIFFRRKTLTTTTTSSSCSTSNRVTTSGILEGFLYDPVERTWYRLTFPSWLSTYTPAASSNGLLTWVSDESGYKSLVVSNPVMKLFALLPPTLTPRLHPSVGLVTTDSAFYLMVAGDDVDTPYNVRNKSAESITAYQNEANQVIFSSIWSTRSQLPHKFNPHTTRMVFLDGKFYFMNYNKYKVISYDIGMNSWVEMDPPMLRALRTPGLVECGGRLILVSKIHKKKLTVPNSFRIWIYQGGEWSQIENMPERFYTQFAAVENGNGFDCVGHGDFIVITINGSDRILLFDLRKKQWEWVPNCPYLYHYGGGGGSLHAFAYEPRIETPVIRFFGQFS